MDVIHPSTCTTNVDCCLIGVKGTIYPDILAAAHYPNLSNGTHGLQVQFLQQMLIELLSESQGAPLDLANYVSNTLGIGQTLYASDDNDYHGAESVVTSQTSLGTYYFFDDASNVDGGKASSD